MIAEVVNKAEYRVNSWSGGTTTQLSIYPEQAEYEKRNFLWRISSAKIELEESIFTSLPGFNRVLMVLKGDLILEHRDHYTVNLEPFQQDRFMGDWNTKSYGKAIDFNLIMDKSCHGEIEPIFIRRGETLTISKCKTTHSYDNISESLYVVKGCANIVVGSERYHDIKETDILSISRLITEEFLIKITNLESDELIIIRSLVYY